MASHGGGNIVNISSIGGLLPDVSRLGYGVSKAAINYLTKAIALQFGSKNIRCNAVAPGMIDRFFPVRQQPAGKQSGARSKK